MRLDKSLSLVFAAGSLGALANSLFVWLVGATGITAAFDIAIAPALTPQWLYPRIVWGGIWGLLFLLSLSSDRWVRQGLVLSLGPTLVQLFVVFPFKAQKGILGLELGLLTPVLVIIANGVWGLVAAYWLRRIR